MQTLTLYCSIVFGALEHHKAFLSKVLGVSCSHVGNDCVFEYNKLSYLCYEVTDSGGFYSGCSWIDRGNIIRHSTFNCIVTTEKTSPLLVTLQCRPSTSMIRGCESYKT